jgi:hypothetical protein
MNGDMSRTFIAAMCGFAFVSMVSVASAATLPTEFPASADIQAPDGMPEAARKIWQEQRATQETRMSKSARSAAPLATSGALVDMPIQAHAFKTLEERLAQLGTYKKSLPDRLRDSWVQRADVGKTPLAKCSLVDSIPTGAEVDGRLTANLRAYKCGAVGYVMLKEEVARKGGFIDMTSAESVNAKLAINGIDRGVVFSRMERPGDGKGLSYLRWRSGEKYVTLEVSGADLKAVKYLEAVATNLPD